MALSKHTKTQHLPPPQQVYVFNDCDVVTDTINQMLKKNVKNTEKYMDEINHNSNSNNSNNDTTEVNVNLQNQNQNHANNNNNTPGDQGTHVMSHSQPSALSFEKSCRLPITPIEFIVECVKSLEKKNIKVFICGIKGHVGMLRFFLSMYFIIKVIVNKINDENKLIRKAILFFALIVLAEILLFFFRFNF